ncbi:MAG TPA: glycosyltransferase family 4 protein [Thermoanaerobaculia bacterium]|nr:glycosyltransferase family 4 protein [Thermoanaerobaculia bacterium]
MKIAVFSHYFTPEIGAPSARIHDLSREWLRAGHSVHIVTCFPNHPTGQIYPGYAKARYFHETLDGFDVHRLWSYVTPNRGIIKRTLGHVSFMLSSMLMRKSRLARPDVIVGTSPTLFAAIAAERMAARLRVPFIMEVRDLWPALFADLGILRNKTILGILERLELWLYRRAAGIVTVTEAFRQNLISRGVPAEKVLTIPNGADIDFWREDLADPQRVRTEYGLGDEFIVLYIGAHGISQGLSAVVDAAALLRDQPDVEFVFVGEGADKPVVMERAKTTAASNVRFLDPVDKRGVRDLYAAANVCLVPLRDVPLFSTFIPSKMFEILAMGRPIVASVRGETAEILSRSGAAVVVEPENAQQIADAIRSLKAAALPPHSKGRVFVEREYSRRALAERYDQFFNETIARFRGKR